MGCHCLLFHFLWPLPLPFSSTKHLAWKGFKSSCNWSKQPRALLSHNPPFHVHHSLHLVFLGNLHNCRHSLFKKNSKSHHFSCNISFRLFCDPFSCPFKEFTSGSLFHCEAFSLCWGVWVQLGQCSADLENKSLKMFSLFRRRRKYTWDTHRLE